MEVPRAKSNYWEVGACLVAFVVVLTMARPPSTSQSVTPGATSMGSLFRPLSLPSEFDTYDLNGDNHIDVEELANVSETSIIEASKPFAAADVNRDGLIDKEEFGSAPWDLKGSANDVNDNLVENDIDNDDDFGEDDDDDSDEMKSESSDDSDEFNDDLDGGSDEDESTDDAGNEDDDNEDDMDDDVIDDDDDDSSNNYDDDLNNDFGSNSDQ